jgi:hypothetical protein
MPTEQQSVQREMTKKEFESLMQPKTNTPDIQDSGATKKQLTFGEKAVGLSFNPGGHEKVEAIKRAYADIIDLLADYRTGNPNDEKNPEVARMLSIAITESQTAQMWAVKAVTWQH